MAASRNRDTLLQIKPSNTLLAIQRKKTLVTIWNIETIPLSVFTRLDTWEGINAKLMGFSTDNVRHADEKYAMNAIPKL